MAHLTRRALLAAGPVALACPAIVRAQVFAPFRIGEINDYSNQPLTTLPYRKGWQMAVEKVNALGGVNGRKIEMVSRDDGGDADKAASLAEELLSDQKVDLLAGGLRSEVGRAISAVALQKKTVYIASQTMSDALVWSQGNHYTYQIRPSTFMLAAMLVESVAALPPKTWATVARDDDFGRSAVRWFREQLTARQPGVRFVGQQWIAAGPIDGDNLAQALVQPAPGAIFNALYGDDLLAFVRGGNAHGLFGGRSVASLLTGEPEWLAQLGDVGPAGWIVTGYPWRESDEPYNKQFVGDYQAQYNEPPTMGAALGSALVSAVTAGLLKSTGGGSSETIADAFAGATFTTPFGICSFRAIDHQSTMGSYVGQLAKVGDRSAMVNWRYVDGASVLPPNDVVERLRRG